MLKKIYHKKNELFEVEFFKDKECTKAFDVLTTDAKHLYIELENGDVTPLSILLNTTYHNAHLAVVHTPYIPCFDKIISEANKNGYVLTLNDITPDLSKYIPEDNAVLFLDGEKISLCDYDEYYNMFSGYRDIEFEGKIIKGMPYHPQIYGIHTIGDRVSVHKHEYDIDDYTNFTLNILKNKKLTIFLPHGTQSELQKANEVAKELKEKYGVEEVNLFVLHNFLKELSYNSKITYYEEVASSVLEDAIFCDRVWEAWNYGTMSIDDFARMEDGRCEDMIQERANLLFNIIELNKTPKQIFDECKNRNFTSYKEPTLLQYINKIITTNSTGILKPEDSNERLQVIDCFDIFQDHLNNI